MAYSTINKSTLYQNQVLWSGNATARNITGVGFQPDMTWIKGRNIDVPNNVFDVVRGATKHINTSATTQESTQVQSLTSWNSDGFALGTHDDSNGSGRTYVGWNWKANGAGSANTDGSISSTVSANTTSGFSIVSYTGTGATATVGHGLGVVPKMIIAKNLATTNAWIVYHEALGNTSYLMLNTTDTTQVDTDWNNTSPTSTVFNLGTQGNANGSTNAIIAYCFADVDGYSKFGSYTGNGNADGTFIYTGFKPAWLMVKRKNSTSNWTIVDTTRAPHNIISIYSDANLDTVEGSYAGWDIVSNGFKFRNTDAGINASGGTYIYMAFGQPIISNSGTPATAR